MLIPWTDRRLCSVVPALVVSETQSLSRLDSDPDRSENWAVVSSQPSLAAKQKLIPHIKRPDVCTENADR